MLPLDDQTRRKVTAAKSAVVARWFELRDRAVAQAQADAESEATGGEAGEESVLDRYMPTPQIAAVAVMALLAAGVVLGAVTDPFAQSASAPIVMLGSPASAPKEEAAPPEVETEYVEEEAPEGVAATEAPPPAPEEIFEEGPEEAGGEPTAPIELPIEALLPPVTHLYLIVLGDQGYESTFGEQSTSPYLSKTLAKKGEVLDNYYAVAGSDLANQIALLSGQGPTPQTAADCPEYTDIAPGTVAAATVGSTEQVEGAGCVYPAPTLTLPGQLTAAGMTWKAYIEGAEPPAACGQGSNNPLAYFHSLLDSGECAGSVTSFGQLGADLKKPVTEAPALTYIVPGPCHDGSEEPCAPGQPAGMAGAESFLQTVVPEIEATDAYKVGGLIAITFAQAPQTGPAADPSACCATPEYPNLKADPNAPPVPPAPGASGAIKPSGGGGRVGMMLISPYILPGSVNSSGYFNHYSLLRSIEELFGLPLLGYAAEPAVIPFDETVYNHVES